MMDFQTGPYSKTPTTSLTPTPVLVVGLGQAGINILDQMTMHGEVAVDTLALDTDLLQIESSVVTDKLLLGVSTARGLGCTGDISRARQIWQQEFFSVDKSLVGHRDVIILVGLGGGTGSGFALELVKSAKAKGARTLVVAMMPFSFETNIRQEVARRVLIDLRSAADGVLVLANERMLDWPCARESIRRAYHTANQAISEGVQGLLHILTAPGMMPLEFSDVVALFGRYRGEQIVENCWMGSASVESQAGVEELVEEALRSPYLAEASAWGGADTCLAALVGGQDLALGDLQNIQRKLESRMGRFVVRLGAKLVSGYEGRLRLSLILANSRVTAEKPYSELFVPDTLKAPIQIPTPPAASVPAAVQTALTAPVMAAVVPPPVIKAAPSKPKPESVVDEEVIVTPAKVMAKAATKAPVREMVERVTTETGTTKRRGNKQEELAFEPNRGRFEKSFETIYRGENLDQPTFRRRKLAIKV